MNAQKPICLSGGFFCAFFIIHELYSMGWKKLFKHNKTSEGIGLALGGGAVLGAAHIGVLRAIEENEIPISYISGTSIGALVGAFFAFGKSWEEIHHLSKKLNWIDISSLSLNRYGLLSNEKMGLLLEKHLGKVNIEDAKIPFTAVACNIARGEKVVLQKGQLSRAVTASASIPGIFHPVEIEGQLLVDGGIIENVPVTTVRAMGAEYVIAVDLNSTQQPGRPENILSVLLNSFHYVMKEAVRKQTDAADLLLEPDLSAYNWTDTGHVEALIQKGYEEARLPLKELMQL